MSVKGRAWANSVRGLRKLRSARLVLDYLGDRHDIKRDLAWPTIAQISEGKEIPERTVKFAMARLEQLGLITTVQKANQYRRSQYRLNFDITDVQGQPLPVPQGQRTAGATRVQGQRTASAGATNDIVIEEVKPLETVSTPPPTPPSSAEDEKPRWWEILSREPRWPDEIPNLIEDVERKFGQLDLEAEALKALAWLQSGTASAKKKKTAGMPRFWINWLDSAAKYAQEARTNGRARDRPDIAGPNRIAELMEDSAER